jgi:hypothetical protein
MSGIVLALAGRTATSVPGAPTIGTATATGLTTATVAFTQPASDGGAVITTYTATSNPGSITGTLSQAGSGTITVSGLTTATSYTFTVTATNAIGTSPASAASNSITTFEAPPTVIGQAYGGGFYAGQIGVSSVATHYLVVAPKSTGQSTLQVETPLTSTTVGNDEIDGPTNTAALVASGSAANWPAPHFCNDLVTGGRSDWYMPAILELEICYYNLKPTTTSNITNTGINPYAVPARASNYTAGNPVQTSASAFQTTNAEAFSYVSFYAPRYWSSTRRLYQNMKAKNFFYGRYGNYQKSNPYPVRAVRRVPV